MAIARLGGTTRMATAGAALAFAGALAFAAFEAHLSPPPDPIDLGAISDFESGPVIYREVPARSMTPLGGVAPSAGPTDATREPGPAAPSSDGSTAPGASDDPAAGGQVGPSGTAATQPGATAAPAGPGGPGGVAPPPSTTTPAPTAPPATVIPALPTPTTGVTTPALPTVPLPTVPLPTAPTTVPVPVPDEPVLTVPTLPPLDLTTIPLIEEIGEIDLPLLGG